MQLRNCVSVSTEYAIPPISSLNVCAFSCEIEIYNIITFYIIFCEENSVQGESTMTWYYFTPQTTLKHWQVAVLLWKRGDELDLAILFSLVYNFTQNVTKCLDMKAKYANSQLLLEDRNYISPLSPCRLYSLSKIACISNNNTNVR